MEDELNTAINDLKNNKEITTSEPLNNKIKSELEKEKDPVKQLQKAIGSINNINNVDTIITGYYRDKVNGDTYNTIDKNLFDDAIDEKKLVGGGDWYSSKKSYTSLYGLDKNSINLDNLQMFGSNYENSIKYYKSLQDIYNKKIDIIQKKIKKKKVEQIDTIKPEIIKLASDTKNVEIELSQKQDENNLLDYLQQHKSVDKCKNYIAIMKKYIDIADEKAYNKTKEAIKKAYKAGKSEITIDNTSNSYADLYDKSPWGGLVGSTFQHDRCYQYSMITTIIDFAIRTNSKNICLPHGLQVEMTRPYSGYYGAPYDSIQFVSSNPRDRILIPLAPTLKLSPNYKQQAWMLAEKELKNNGKAYTVDGKIMTKIHISNNQTAIKNIEKKENINIAPVEDLSDWFQKDFTKKIPSYKKGADPKFNTPSKIRYAIERCLFNKEGDYEPEKICGICIPLSVTAGIEDKDNDTSQINHANMIYIQKNGKDKENKQIFTLYVFDPNYDPTYYIAERLEEVIADINKEAKGYRIEESAQVMDLTFGMSLSSINKNEDGDKDEYTLKDKTGIHSLFPSGWIGGGICGSVTWFIFILWSLICKEVKDFKHMYTDICVPLYLYKLHQQRKKEGLELNIFADKEGGELLTKIEDIYFDFLTVIWEFLKWSGEQLKDNNNEKVHDYRYKTCLLDRILYKLHKYGIDEKGNNIE